MNTAIVAQTAFEKIRHTGAQGEYWSARELMAALGYTTWRKFAEAMERASAACENSGQGASDHFVPSGKLIEAGKGARRKVEDYRLSRYACYLTAMNGDPRKPEIAAAQTYFAVKTREAEMKPAPALDMTDPLAIARAFVAAETERRQLTLKIQEDAPKVQAHDALMRAEGLYSIQAAGKILGWGEIKLYQWLRENGILMSRERNGDALHNIPYQTHMDAGRFEVKARAVVMGNTERMVSTPYVTAKGLDYLFKRLEGKPRPLQLPMIGAAVPA